jgi:hypothetical protein
MTVDNDTTPTTPTTPASTDTAAGYAAQAAAEAAAQAAADPTATGAASDDDIALDHDSLDAVSEVHDRIDGLEHAFSDFAAKMEALLTSPAVQQVAAQVAAVQAPEPVAREPITEDNLETTVHGILDTLDRITHRLWPTHI